MSSCGIVEEIPESLFAQTMKGSAEMLLNSGMSAEMLEDKLRLKGGTTLAAFDKMDELGFDRPPSCWFLKEIMLFL